MHAIIAHAQQLSGRKALLAVGTASQEHDVDGVQVDILTVTHVHDLHRNAAPRAATLQDAHVAKVSVQVQQIWEEMGYAQNAVRRGMLVLATRGVGG